MFYTELLNLCIAMGQLLNSDICTMLWMLSQIQFKVEPILLNHGINNLLV